MTDPKGELDGWIADLDEMYGHMVTSPRDQPVHPTTNTTAIASILGALRSISDARTRPPADLEEELHDFEQLLDKVERESLSLTDEESEAVRELLARAPGPDAKGYCIDCGAVGKWSTTEDGHPEGAGVCYCLVCGNTGSPQLRPIESTPGPTNEQEAPGGVSGEEVRPDLDANHGTQHPATGRDGPAARPTPSTPTPAPDDPQEGWSTEFGPVPKAVIEDLQAPETEYPTPGAREKPDCERCVEDGVPCCLWETEGCVCGCHRTPDPPDPPESPGEPGPDLGLLKESIVRLEEFEDENIGGIPNFCRAKLRAVHRWVATYIHQVEAGPVCGDEADERVSRLMVERDNDKAEMERMKALAHGYSYALHDHRRYFTDLLAELGEAHKQKRFKRNRVPEPLEKAWRMASQIIEHGHRGKPRPSVGVEAAPESDQREDPLVGLEWARDYPYGHDNLDGSEVEALVAAAGVRHIGGAQTGKGVRHCYRLAVSGARPGGEWIESAECMQWARKNFSPGTGFSWDDVGEGREFLAVAYGVPPTHRALDWSLGDDGGVLVYVEPIEGGAGDE